MTDRESVESKYAAELRRRGFKELGCAMRISDEEAFELGESYHVVQLFKDPFFIYLRGKSPATYAMDETGMFLMHDGMADISDIPCFTKHEAPPDFAPTVSV